MALIQSFTLSQFFDLVREYAGNPDLSNSRIFLYMRLNFPFVASFLRATNKDITLQRKQFTNSSKVIPLSTIFDDVEHKRFYIFVENLYVIVDNIPIKLKPMSLNRDDDIANYIGTSYYSSYPMSGFPMAYYHEGTTINLNVIPDKEYTFLIEYYPYSFNFLFRNYETPEEEDPVIELSDDNYTDSVALNLPEEFIRLYALKVADDIVPMSSKDIKADLKDKLAEAIRVVYAMSGKTNSKYRLDTNIDLRGIR